MKKVMVRQRGMMFDISNFLILSREVSNSGIPSLASDCDPDSGICGRTEFDWVTVEGLENEHNASQKMTMVMTGKMRGSGGGVQKWSSSHSFLSNSCARREIGPMCVRGSF